MNETVIASSVALANALELPFHNPPEEARELVHCASCLAEVLLTLETRIIKYLSKQGEKLYNDPIRKARARELLTQVAWSALHLKGQRGLVSSGSLNSRRVDLYRISSFPVYSDADALYWEIEHLRRSFPWLERSDFLPAPAPSLGDSRAALGSILDFYTPAYRPLTLLVCFIEAIKSPLTSPCLDLEVFFTTWLSAPWSKADRPFANVLKARLSQSLSKLEVIHE